MSKFFINRTIVAMVIAILMVIVSAVTISTLPITQFPNIAPPEIWLQATYPGTDAKTLEDAVATPIEQQVNGVDNMTYMYSLNATANQQTQLMIDFELKTDPNMDLMLTQSREQLATGQLPPSVNSYGVSVKKAVTAPLMIIDLYSPHGTPDETYLSNYAYINLNDPIARLYGVGQTQVFGTQIFEHSVAQHSQVSDEQLLSRARSGDQMAFGELCLRYTGMLKQRIFRIVRNREDAEDVLQETLLRAYRHLDTFRSTCRVSTGMMKIGINTSLMILRKRRSMPEVISEQVFEDGQRFESPEFRDPRLNPEQRYIADQTIDKLRSIMRRSSPRNAFRAFETICS
jgi:RNA polymerase sigma factor (sigma-70 family)